MVWILFLVMSLNLVDRVVINVLADPISKELHLSDTQVGLLTGLAFAICYNLSGISLGRLSDRPGTNRVWLIAGALSAWSGATALCGAANNYFHLVLARMGVAVSEAGCIPPAHSLIADTVPIARRARALAIFGFGVPVGALIGKAGGGVLATEFGWRSAFLLVGLPGALLAVILVVFIREPRRTHSVVSAPTIPVREVLAIILRSPALIYMILGTSAAMFLITGGSVWGMVHFLRNHHLSTATAGVWLGISGGVAGVIGTWVGGWAADRFGHRNPRHYMTPAALAMVASVPLLFFGWYQSDWRWALVLLFLPDMFDNMYYGGTFAAVQSLVPAEARATVTACFLFVTTMIGMGFGALTFGMASDMIAPLTHGSESVRWVLMGAAILYLVPGFCYWRASVHLSRELPGTVDQEVVTEYVQAAQAEA